MKTVRPQLVCKIDKQDLVCLVSQMRLSRHAHYAIRIVLDLLEHPRSRSAEVARRQGLPPSYMPKIVQQLVRAGIVRTFRGVHGGVQLAKPASAMTLRDVVEAAEGPLAINVCVVWGDCPCTQPCPVRAALARVHASVERELDQITLESLSRTNVTGARRT